MYSWIVRRVLSAQIRRLNAGDPELVEGFAKDARLVFPGSSSFAGDHHPKDEIDAWFRRFLELRPQFELHEVGVAGSPWNMRVFFRFTDRIAVPDGGPDYQNEGMEYLRIRWGKIREQRVYLDTEKVADFDARLAAVA
jgi:ketosteroid isomerase-like protein